MTGKLRIVAAAIEREGTIFSSPPPARHHTLMRAMDRLFGDKHNPFTPDEQGFLGSDGRFYRREKAAKIALLAGQVSSVLNGRLSMRDVDRDPPEYEARLTTFQIPVTVRGRHPRIGRSVHWIARDGLICAPTHYLPTP